jgi:hypothetical protein
MKMFLLHVHEAEAGFFDGVFLHAIKETLGLLPFLFLTYLLIEYIEHNAKERAEAFLSRSGAFAPIFGGLAGAIPQCGFSAAASNLYSGGVITLGTLIAVFLSTSDEMLPILITGNFSIKTILAIMAYKTAVAILCGVAINVIYRPSPKAALEDAEHHERCHCHHDHCEGGIIRPAILHTIKITIFILFVNFGISSAVYFMGEDALVSILPEIPLVSHFIASIFGLIPNCAASVALTTLAAEGIISVGEMMSGLLSGAGIGMAILLRRNRPRKENLAIILIVVVIGAVFGLLADTIMPNILFNT